MSDLEIDDIQGLLARGYGRLRAARFLALTFGSAGMARQWLASVTDEVTPASRDPHDIAVHVALSAPGLATLGLPSETLSQFAFEFREGMTTEHRKRVLGDFGGDDPAGWRWGGPNTAQVHAVLMLYAADEASLGPLVERHLAELGAAGISTAASLESHDIGDVEPFGFRDGISQPVVKGLGREGRPDDTVRAGEFILGYANEYGLLTDSPLVSENSATPGILPPGAERATRDLGRNGTYLVVRQLEQDVAGFWRYLDRFADSPDECVRVASKMVGRWPGGAPLALSPDFDDAALEKANDFAYHKADPHGMRCPVASHVRRTNPRDSLDPNPGSDDSTAVNKRHRILRRGRSYGPRMSMEQALSDGDDGVERGLHFVCLAANIARQFEFIQHTWANNPKFDGLYDEVDPIMGPRGESGATFSMPAEPVRKRITGIPSFVTVRGGGYFFLPGIRALRYLATVGDDGGGGA